MFRALVLITCLIPSAALAQSVMTHSMAQEGGMTMHTPANGLAASEIRPVQPGNGAFAAIQEIVDLPMADPKTGWSKVDIDALRQHLVEIDDVTR